MSLSVLAGFILAPRQTVRTSDCPAVLLILDEKHSCSARAKRTLFSGKSARTLTHFIPWTDFTFFSWQSLVFWNWILNS